MDIDYLKNELSNCLPRSRFIHSLGVMEEAIRLSNHFGGNEEKACIAGLLHDITKAVPYPEQLKMCNEFGIMLNNIEKISPKLLHAVTGAEVVQRKFNINDSEIIDAIRYHTTARKNMSVLEKIIYLADFIEPNRDFDGVNELRKKIYNDLEKGLLACLDYSIIEIISKRYLLHPNTVEARNFLLNKEKYNAEIKQKQKNI